MKILRKPVKWGTCEIYNGPKWDARLVNLGEVIHHRSRAGVTKQAVVQMLVFRRYELEDASQSLLKFGHKSFS